jgi:hypothetical protein
MVFSFRRTVVAAVAIVVSSSLASASSAHASYGFEISPRNGPAGSRLQLSFRAPYGEVEDCCSEDLYYMEVRSASSRCLRRAFPDADPENRPRVVMGGFGQFGDVRTNGKPLRDRYVRRGEKVVIRLHAPRCHGVYRGQITYSYLTEDQPSFEKVIGRFTVRVRGRGVLAFTGFDARLTAVLGAALILGGLGVRVVTARSVQQPATCAGAPELFCATTRVTGGLFRKRLMGLEPTTFCMARASGGRGSAGNLGNKRVLRRAIGRR